MHQVADSFSSDMEKRIQDFADSSTTSSDTP